MAVRDTLDEAAAETLAETFHGEIGRSTDDEYDDARAVWNGMIDGRPAVIARCTGVADVVTAVGVAREHDLRVAVRSGGHDVAGTFVCDGGIVIDLSEMTGIHVDPAERTAHAQAGVTWREFDRETQAFGWMTPGGAVSTTARTALSTAGASTV